MNRAYSTLNGLHPRTADVVKAVNWTLLVNPSVPHFIEAAIYWQALSRACACTGGYARRCEDHRG